MNAIKKARNNKLKSKEIYEIIVSKLNSGELKRGDYINENQFSQDLKISRTKIREALNQLLAIGFVEKRDNNRTYIIDPQEKEIRSLIQFRAVIESGSAFLAAQFRSEAAVKELKLLLKNLSDCKKDDWMKMFEIEKEFHCLIVSQSLNEMLINAYNHIRIQMSFMPNMTNSSFSVILTSHELLFKAIEKRESQNAFLLMWQHILGPDAFATGGLQSNDPKNILNNLASLNPKKIEIYF
jgi:DNA-binding GntR family transcriptional regulator